MTCFQWDGELSGHTYIGIAETVEEARAFVIARIRDYHNAPDGDKYTASHESEVQRDPTNEFALPAGIMIVNYA